jgi:hypothetical protein
MHDERNMAPAPLIDALRSIASEDADRGASPHVETALRAHVRSLRRPPRRWVFTGVAAAASIAIVALVWHVVPPPVTPDTATAGQRARPAETAGEFLPLPYAHVPAADGQVVRMAVPRAALASFGLDADAPGLPDVVQADVFIGEDGIARSVRFVDWSVREEPTP